MIQTIRQVLTGTDEMDEKLKYISISLMICLVHVVFTTVFFINRLTLPAFYNVGAVIFYVINIIVIAKNDRYAAVFGFTFLEIMLHSCFVTVLLGWDLGFMSYTVSLIPLAFYVTYTIKYLRGKLHIPIIVSLLVFIANFCVLGIIDLHGPLMTGVVSPGFESRMYAFNLLLTFIYLIIISILFSVEIRYMQYHLEAENISLSRMANFDALTRLMNRRSMNVQLKQVMDSVELGGETEDMKFCLMMADIDDFKKVNDTYGHPKGDEVLVEVARVLQSNVREEDKVCRWGGEEMLILLRSDMDVAKNVAQRICNDMEGVEIETDSDPISVTLTIGVAEYKPGDSIRSLIDLADQRMYLGKRSGKNCVVWN